MNNIEKLIETYEGLARRYKVKEQALEEKGDNLSKHGYWSLGYCEAKADLYAEVAYKLKNLLKDGEAK